MPQIRVDEEVYRKLLAVKHRLEAETGRTLSLSDAVMALANEAKAKEEASVS